MSTESTPPIPRLVTIEVLNGLAREDFELAIRPLFETAPLLADRLFTARPYQGYEHLLDCAERLTANLSPDQKVQVINAHPRIGQSRETVRQTSALSFREQGYDREPAEDAAMDDVYRDLAELNQAYEERFGFRFVVFVNRRPRSAILDVMRARLANPRDTEMTTALADMLLIARDRLPTLTK